MAAPLPHPDPAAPLFTRAFVAGALGNATMALAFFMYMSSVAGYTVDVLKATPTTGGIVSGIFVLAATLGRLLTGPLVTALGRRVALLWAIGVFVAASGGYLLTHTLAGILIARSLHGLALGVGATTLGAVTLAEAPPHRSGEASGWFGAGLAVATGIGPVVATQALRLSGYQAIFALGFLLSFATLGLTWVALSPVPGRARGQRLRRPPLTPSTFIATPALPIGAVALLPACGFAAVLTYLNAYAAQTGLATWATFYFLVYAAIIVPARPIAGMIQDRLGHDVVLVPALLSAAGGLALTAWAPSGPVLLAGAFFLGLGYGTLISAGQAMAISRVGPLNVGLAVGSYYLLVDTGTGAGPMVLGPVAEAWGYSAMIGTGAVIAAVAVVVYLGWVSQWALRRRGR